MGKSILLNLLCFFFISCENQNASLEKMESVFYTDSIILLKNDSKIMNDTVYLNDIIDNVKYVNIDLPNTEHIFQIQYTDSCIFVSNNISVFIFNHKGKKIRTIPLNYGCFDISKTQDSIYTYTPLYKRLNCYDLKGNKIWTSNLHYKGKDIGFYGHSFAQINDSLFAIAIANQGFNPDQLIIVNKSGKVKKHIPNSESFVYPGVCYTAHTAWKRTLTKNKECVFYHPLYGDTVYIVNRNMQLEPYIIEQKVNKVPLEDRPEYTGNTWKQFNKVCLDNSMYVTRIFNTSRYVIVDYRLGSIGNHMSNYWIFDKKEKEIKRTFNNLSLSLSKGKAHFGIFNNYDGGLAFVPEFISNEHLIMVNAGDLQGKKTIYAKQMHSNHVQKMKHKYLYRSDIYRNLNTKKEADYFWTNCDENKIVLTIVKMKE